MDSAQTYAHSTATLIAAFCANGGTLTKRAIEDALFGFDQDQVQLAMAELEAAMGLEFHDVGHRKHRVYTCPRAVRLFAGRKIARAV